MFALQSVVSMELCAHFRQKSRAEFKHAARVQVRRLILRRRLEAAKLLRVMTATVDPQLRGD